MRRSVCLILFGLAPVAASAQTPEAPPATFTEQITVTGHAEEVPFQSLARAVVVLPAEAIARLPARSVTDVLGYAASLDVRSRGPFGVQSDFAVRGATFGQALVLLDGVRLNEMQTGHHNADIPVPLEEIDRIEILMGPGSSLYGADAFGGTINILTRRNHRARGFSVSGGSFGFVSGDGVIAGMVGSVHESLTIAADRSDGFISDRDFRTLTASSQTSFSGGTRLRVAFQWKDFGAAGFYGPAPSTERTNQTLATLDGRVSRFGAWTGTWQAGYRTHGDEFLYDPRSSSATNLHRSHAITSTARLGRALTDRVRVTIGAEGGADWIRSNALGDHDLVRGSLFAEAQWRVSPAAFVYPAMRVDQYSTFGTAWSPSLSAAAWAGRQVKLRASIGRAFRVPTFTERFYVDPNNRGTSTLIPEQAWATEGGVDWVTPGGWMSGVTIFDRREHGTIDWVRASSLVPWQATNVRQVAARGIELNVRRTLPGNGLVAAQYTRLDETTDPLPLLSKYVLEYARDALVLSASAPLPGALDIGQRAAYKRKRTGVGYWLIDTRIGRRMGSATVFVEGSNLLNTPYQEITGVDMPGRAIRAGVRVNGAER